MRLNDFIERIHLTWSHWIAHFEKFPSIDSEETDQSLTLLLPDRKIYLFNMHAGMQQLWMSSPISGGRHFASSPEEVLVGAITDALPIINSPLNSLKSDDMLGNFYWRDTRNGQIIEDVLNQEFEADHGIQLALTSAQRYPTGSPSSRYGKIMA
jgi:frataxin-like iron-binding protein CyaY